MSALGTILTTAAVGIGAVAVARHLKKRMANLKSMVEEAARNGMNASEEKQPVIDLEKNPDTGVFETKE